MVRGKIIKSKVLMRVWACLLACLVLVCSAPVDSYASNTASLFDRSFLSAMIYNGSVSEEITKTYRFYESADGVAISNTGKYVTIGGGTAVYDLDVDFGNCIIDIPSEYNISQYDDILLRLYSYLDTNLYNVDIGVGLGLEESSVVSVKPYVLINGDKKYFVDEKYTNFSVGANSQYITLQFGVEVQVIISFDATSVSDDSIATRFAQATLNITRSPVWFAVYGVNYVSTGDMAILDAIKGLDTTVEVQIEKSEEEIALQEQQNQLQQEQNTLQEEQNALQEEENKLQEESNETQKNIFEKIVDFFDNFFDRLGDFLLHIIVPSAEELTAFLDEVNTWFGERLGFLWFPFSFAIEIVQVFALGEADSMFRVPGFKLNILGTEYQIWNELTVDMDAFGIFKYVRFFTSALLISGVVKLAVSKWDAWIGGRSAS